MGGTLASVGWTVPTNPADRPDDEWWAPPTLRAGIDAWQPARFGVGANDYSPLRAGQGRVGTGLPTEETRAVTPSHE